MTVKNNNNMKTKMKRQGSMELPRFVVGVLATAGASVASGATVQITFANNVVSSATGLTNSVADLTGDGEDDVYANFSAGAALVQTLNGTNMAFGQTFAAGQYVIVKVGDLGGVYAAANAPILNGLYEFTFTDSRINSGDPTAGFLDMTAVGGVSVNSVRIHRLIFDDASIVAPSGVAYTDSAFPEWGVSAVPEPGSNLALLALGAGGLNLRRRLKRAA